MNDVLAEIEQEIRDNEVVLYMKGTPAFPMCGFSAAAVKVLKEVGVPFKAVDVLAEPEKREAIKQYSNWPTIPQVYVGGKFVGGSDILREMHEAREHMNLAMKDAINVAERVFKPDEGSRMEYVIAGETNLMGAGELSSVDKLRRLFEAFSEKRDILNLLDLSLRADGVQIFIGQESGFRILDDCSVVTAPYSADNEVVGVIGVIGPTRMTYERIIPIVDVTAKILGAALARR